MSETSKNRAIEVLNRDQNQLDNVYVNQSEYNAPEKIEKITERHKLRKKQKYYKNFVQI